MKLNVVPARTGLQWVRQGVAVFWRQPLAFSGLFFMLVAATSLLAMLPWVGNALALALTPAATVGLMAATQMVAEQKRFPLPATLLIGLRQSPAATRALLALGALYAAALLLIAAATAWGSDNQLTQLLARHGGNITPELMNDPAVQQAIFASLPQTLLTSVLYLVVAVVFWHAPALVHWHRVPVVKSLFFSTIAVLRNTPAFALFGLGWMAIMALAWFVLVSLALTLGNLNWAMQGALPVGLVLTAMFCASLWFTFRDCFVAEPDAQEPAPPPR
jgi:hypothetical protein